MKKFHGEMNSLMRIIRSNERFLAEHGWLTSRFSFSFSEYYDPSNRLFGPLRVFNDDIIQPGEGFGMHPHQNMEIMTYVIEGRLEHRDSMGNVGHIQAGEVQRMTAGTGVLHSEYNAGDHPVHLLQIWFMPLERGLEPSWEQRSFGDVDRTNRLVPVISGTGVGDSLTIHQDVTVYLSDLMAGGSIHHEQVEGRKMYLFVVDGEVEVDGETLAAGDTARISAATTVDVHSKAGAHILFMDLAA